MRLLALMLVMIIGFSCHSTNKNDRVQMTGIDSLIIVEYESDRGLASIQHLVSYNFEKGLLISKDTIYTARKNDTTSNRISFMFDGHFIENDRYAISRWGDVIDVKEKTLINKDGYKYLETIEDNFVFHAYTKDGLLDFLLYNFNTQTYHRADNEFSKIIRGNTSPNHLFALEVNKSNIPWSIDLINSKSERKTIIENCGIGTSPDIHSSSLPTVPMRWIDDSKFLYPHIDIQSNLLKIDLRMVNIENERKESLGILDSINPSLFIGADLYEDGNSNLIFICPEGEFKVDVESKTIQRQEIRELGNAFYADRFSDDFGHIIKFRNDTIGKLWCRASESKTTEGYFAVEFGEPGSNLGYPKGIKVWSEASKKWTTIEIPFVFSIIGWIKK